MSDQNMLIHLAAGGIAGTTGAILTCPLEVVKTRLQANMHLNPAHPPSFPRATALNNHNNVYNATSHSKNQKLTNNNSKLTTRLNCYSNILLRNNHLSHGGSMPMATVASSASSPQQFVANVFNLENTLKHQTAAARRGGHLPALVKTAAVHRPSIYLHFKLIIQNEGFKALFKGLGPNIVGVAPYRAIYFFSYANSKCLLSSRLDADKPIMHMTSAFIAGFSAVTITNPIWFVKTRLQLDESRRGLTTYEVVNKIMREKGPLGFYKGITASYFGICESALYFVIYEQLKIISASNMSDASQGLSMLNYFTSAGFAKSLASCICYPHEVARTRLRQEGDKYKGFFQTLSLIVKEEGARGLYKGMATHLIRQIPNTAIVMTTYEIIVNYCKTKRPLDVDD